MEKGRRLKSLNFSINNECQIPVTSFEYTTSMYTGNDTISRILALIELDGIVGIQDTDINYRVV